MSRSVASNVSALSSGVANGHQTMHHVSSSLSKIPYGGFSPVRLQTGSPRRPSSSTPRSYLYAVQVRPSDPNSPCGQLQRIVCHRTSRPEALGSPASYVVSPGHRLLWPHPRLWFPPADLCFIRRVSVAQLLPTGKAEVPQFTLRASNRRAALRTPVDCAIAHDCYFIAHASLRHFRTGSAPTSPHNRVTVACVTRLQVSLYATARRLARPAPARTFTFELSFPVVAHRKRRI